MECTLKQYKLAWMDNGKLFSSMHDTETEARQAESTISGPTMVMKIHSNDAGNYSWVLLPGTFAFMAKNWLFIALALVIGGVLLFWNLKK
jgi:hypothetical protein